MDSCLGVKIHLLETSVALRADRGYCMEFASLVESSLVRKTGYNELYVAKPIDNTMWSGSLILIYQSFLEREDKLIVSGNFCNTREAVSL